MGLTAVGQPKQQDSQSNPFYNNGPTSSLSSQLSALNNLRDTDQNFEEELNKLRVSNAANLGRMQEEQANKLTNAYMQRYSELTAIQKKQAQELLKEELNAKKRLGELSEDQYKDELARGMEQIDALAAYKMQMEAKEQKAAATAARKAQKEKEKALRKEHTDKLKMLATGEDDEGNRLSLKERRAAMQKYYEEELKAPQLKYDENGEVTGLETEDEAATRVKNELIGGAIASATKAIMDFKQKIDADIESIASLQTEIDTRLQGSNNKKKLGSY